MAGSVLVEPIQGGEPTVFLEIGLIEIDSANAVDLKIHTVARSSHDCGLAPSSIADGPVMAGGD